MNISGVSHEWSGLAGAFVKGVSVVGVAFFDILIWLLREEAGEQEWESEKSFHGSCLQVDITQEIW